ncbi:ABC transporter substrate-binding protein [Paenibacillus sp. HJGM_3]|uniref:ABC transporter substrate-binding protein n=1 Tax=Paenibacillus sp. HJGM_3 TaxID=3379816 RepID=UPI00385CF0E1
MKKTKWLRTLTGVTLTVSLMVPLLAACGKGDGSDAKTNGVLRIATMYGGADDDYFRQQFTDAYEITHPNVKIEIVPVIDNSQYRYAPPKPGEKQPDPLEKLKELMTGPNPPDIAVVNLEQLPDLVSNNMLQQLDPLITKDKFDTADIVPTVLEGLKSAGEGKLYALAPTFTSSALMYNKALFDNAGVAYPKDNMTWDEMFDLARRVSSGEGANRKYGFSFNTYSYGDNVFYEMSNIYTPPLQLRMFNDAGDKMTVDSDRWETVWKTMQGLIKDKVFPEQPDRSQMSKPMNPGSDDYNPFQNDLFKSGRLAMTIVQNYQVYEMITANKSATNVKGFTPIDWDIVTVPTHPETKGVGGNIYMNGIMGINTKAPNPTDAWSFLKFVNGEDWAKLKSRSVSQMVSRKKYIQTRDGLNYNIQAFYLLKPNIFNEMNKLYRDKPMIGQVQSMGYNYFKQAMDGTKGIRDALKEWQTAGDAALQQMKDNPNAPINMAPGAVMKVPY